MAGTHFVRAAGLTHCLFHSSFDDDDDEDDDNDNNDSFNPHKAYPNSKEPATLTRPKDRGHVPTSTQKTCRSFPGLTRHCLSFQGGLNSKEAIPT